MSKKRPQLISNLLLPELERQLVADKALWPAISGRFIITVTKRKKPASTWYLLLQGNDTMPLITTDEQKVRETVKGKRLQTVKIRVEDRDLLNFATGGMTGVKAYMLGKIKVRGDLTLAQRLEEVFAKAGGSDRAMEFVRKNEELLDLTDKAKL